MNNRATMDALVDVLLEKETLTGDEFRAILSSCNSQAAEGFEEKGN